MWRSRLLDTAEVERLTPQGFIKYQFSAGGHELGQVLLAQALDHPHDAATVYYRSRPLLLAAGLTLTEALAAGMARTSSPSEGRDVGVVYNLPRRAGPTILPASGNVGAQYTPAVGWAQAIRYHQETLEDTAWAGAVAVACGGEGSTAANGFWAALNIATTLRLPLVFFIEDNQYGLSVPAPLQTPGGNIAANLAAFQNLHVIAADGSDPESAWAAIHAAVNHARSTAGPALLRLHVARLSGHTFIDDQRYKPPEVLAAEAERDPLNCLKDYLFAQGLAPADWEAVAAVAGAEVEAAITAALALPEPTPAALRQGLLFEGAAPIQGGLRPLGLLPPLGSETPQPEGARLNLIDAVRRTLEVELRLNPRLLVFGEDVGVKGGVHGATLDLQAHFGEARVFDTSLSEDGIIGRAVGMALAGLLPVPEIQFRKYADPAHEQISDLGTLRWRTANRFAAPVVVRIPVGFGKKTGDPWHSVTGEAVYAHTLGWRIAFPSNAADAVGLLRTALRSDDPTFFFEHRALLDTAEGRRPYPGDDYCLPFGQAAQLESGDEALLISWGALVPRALTAARAFPGRVAVLDLRTILPWDEETVLELVQRTGKVLIVHEDTLTAGFGAEIAATLSAKAFANLDAPIARLAMPDIPIPFNLAGMEALLPSAAAITARLAALLAY
jgi:2-oxoisovalerate dehydrogenase E1 component